MPFHRDNTILFCLTPNTKPLTIARTTNGYQTDIPDLNIFLRQNGIIRIEPWIKGAKPTDHDGDIYSNRIYRAYLSDIATVDQERIKRDIVDFPFVLSSEFENRNKPFYTPNDPYYNYQCSLPAVHADQAWDFFFDLEIVPGGREVLLASVDTGVDYTHPDLEESSWINQGEVPSEIDSTVDTDNDGYVDASEVLAYLSDNNMDLNSDGSINLTDALVGSSPFTNNSDDDGNGFTDDLIGFDLSGWSGTDDNDPMPKDGVPTGSVWAHGTHVAGILAATSDNNLGIASTAFNASMISVKCSREEQTGDPYVNDGYAGLIYAAKAGYFADNLTIINLSWGSSGFSNYEQSQINIAHDTYGAVVVAAAGNGSDSPPYGEEYAAHYPSSYDNVISVAAVGCSGTWGHWATYHETIDLSAPGENVRSTIIGTGYASWDGSSMASPNAASCIGLLKSFYPDWVNTDLEERVLETADDFIYDLNTEDYLQGRLGQGMVDVNTAIGAGYLPSLSYYNHTYVWVEDDGDGVLNPGEIVRTRIVIQNEQDRAVAENVSATLSTSNPNIVITDSTAEYPDINPGGLGVNITDTFEFLVGPGVEIGEIDFRLNISATGEAGAEYSTSLHFPVAVSLNQAGWPIDHDSQIESSPAIADVIGDSTIEIIFGDDNGLVHMWDPEGNELENFPFDTGDDIWGSPAVADLDVDGEMEIITTSKSGNLYVLNPDGTVELEYFVDQYLMGTPAIGNLDADDDLEIVAAGYSSSGQIFAINLDGSSVAGFPVDINERIQRGVALGDVDGNLKDDIVIGTDDGNIYLVKDDGSVAAGFPFVAGDDFRSAPAILKKETETIILAGSRDDHFYGINLDGTQKFIVAAGSDVETTPAFSSVNDQVAIFFGSADGFVYGIDSDGNALDGWPVDIGNSVDSSPVIADLDNDGNSEIIAVNGVGMVHAMNMDGSDIQNFPINVSVSTKGTPVIADMDYDQDLEILFGTVSSMIALDIKTIGSIDKQWNMHRGSLLRNGFYDATTLGIDFSVDPGVPTKFSISEVYPNPFNPEAHVTYELPVTANVSIRIYNIIGQEIELVRHIRQSPGIYHIRWQANQHPSGLYFLRYEARSVENGDIEYRETRKMLLVK